MFATELKADELPPGIPRVVDTNGNVLFIDSRFTSVAFQQEGFKLMLTEANKVVADLILLEPIPITKSNVSHVYMGSFGFCYMNKCLGNIETTNYWYNIGAGFKFNALTVADYDDRIIKYKNKKNDLPTTQLDTNAAYSLASQWLSSVHMDVKRLEQDCDVRVQLSTDMEHFAHRKGKFTPLYFVSWTPKNNTEKFGGGAYVELYLPTKKLLQLKVYDSKYILRKPVAFTNLFELFPGKAAITTNLPVPVKIMNAGDAIQVNWPKK